MNLGDFMFCACWYIHRDQSCPYTILYFLQQNIFSLFLTFHLFSLGLNYISFILLGHFNVFSLALIISWNFLQTNPEIKDPADLTILHRRMYSIPAFPFFPETPGKPLAPLSPE